MTHRKKGTAWSERFFCTILCACHLDRMDNKIIFFLLVSAFLPFQCRLLSNAHIYTSSVSARIVQSGSSSLSTVPDVFAELRSSLPNKTNVPLRLPYFLPDSFDASAPDLRLYAILEAADKNEYYIQLAWSSDCEGEITVITEASSGVPKPSLAHTENEFR